MKNLKTFSILLFLVSLIGMYLQWNKRDSFDLVFRTEDKTLLLKETKEAFAINDFQILLSSADTVGELIDKNGNVQGMVAKVERPGKATSDADRKFWGMVIFSIIFTLAALYVILSQKYDDDTKKWAFSIISLIGGVWLGGTIL